MSRAAAIGSDGIDLSTCDREPIHIPGSIQPFGVLLALEEPGGTVLQASENVGDYLGRGVDAVLGRTLEEVFGDDRGATLRAWLGNPSLDRDALYLGTLTLDGHPGPINAIAHRSGGAVVLELEPASTDGAVSFRNLYPLVRTFLARMERAATADELCRLAVDEVRRITGFDRALVYRFDDDGAGTVIAESRNENLPSYLDHRFPASDIPAQARELYRRSRVRLIADAGYRPVPLVPALDPRTGAPLDLGQAVLRSVSPVHVEYMRNMGTAASMSISIVREGRLWGLISCHHAAPRGVPVEVRTACDLLGQVLSAQLEARQRDAELGYRIRLKSVEAKLLASMANTEDFADGLVQSPDVLLAMAAAKGAAVVSRGRCLRVGDAPEEPDVVRLVDWLAEHVGREVYDTDALALAFPEAEAYKDRASGLLAISISKLHRSYLLWFRPEVLRTVRWGGDPRKPVEDDGGGPRLHPRKSFEVWKETVRLRSLPWRPSEVETAVELRNAIVGIVLRRAEELAELNAELRRSNRELEAFSYSVSHDLRAPFRHIVGYSELLLDESDLSETGRRYVRTIIDSAHYAGTLVDNLLAFSQMARTSLHPEPLDMGRLVDEVRRDVMTEAAGRAVRWDLGDLPPACGDPMMIRLAVRNLLANAVKYTRNRDEAVIAVSGAALPGEVVYSVRDNGTGFDMRYVDKLFGVFQRLHKMEEYEGTGIGLANVRRIVERHGGRTWAEGAVGVGATFSFSLPDSPGEAQGGGRPC